MKAKYQLIALFMFVLPMSIIAQPADFNNEPATVAERPTGVKPINLKAELENNQLLISGNFEKDKQYEVTMFDPNGQRIYNKIFNGNNTAYSFEVAGVLVGGEYVIAVKQKSDREITLVKG